MAIFVKPPDLLPVAFMFLCGLLILVKTLHQAPQKRLQPAADAALFTVRRLLTSRGGTRPQALNNGPAGRGESSALTCSFTSA